MQARIYRSILLGCCFLLVSSFALAQRQSLTGFAEAAAESYQLGDYNSAYRYYEAALKYDTSRVDLYYGLGESSRQFTAYDVAERAYREILRRNVDTFPLLQYRLGQVNIGQGDYEQAQIHFQQFLATQPDADATLIRDAQFQINKADWAIEAIDRNQENLLITHLPEGVNTAYSDFGYVKEGEREYFSSYSFEWATDTMQPKRKLIKILERTGNARSRPLPPLINRPNEVVGHTSFNREGDRVYFTICEYVGFNDIRCDLFQAPVDPSNGDWGEPVEVPINMAGFTTTQPNVGYDVTTDGEFLYFASDRPDGLGGLDIYRVPLRPDGSLGEIENLDGINTADDDGTPFYYAPSQVLYFSSTGRFNFGGYDIFRAFWDGDEFERPLNLGQPINSSYNDLYYTQFFEEESAFFSSNRPDSAAIFWSSDRESCCNDIYEFRPDDRIPLLITSLNLLSGNPLDGVTVELYEDRDGSFVRVDTRTNLIDNNFDFLLDPGKTYRVIGRKEGFSEDRAEIDLLDTRLVKRSYIEQELFLGPPLDLDVYTYRGADGSELSGARTTLYEVSDLRRDTKEPALLPPAMNPQDNEFGNDFHFPLTRSRIYYVEATRENYNRAGTYIDLRGDEYIDSTRLIRDLHLYDILEAQVFTFNAIDTSVLNGVDITLYEIDPVTGNELPIRTINSANANDAHFPLEVGKQYVIRGLKNGYGPAYAEIDMRGYDPAKEGNVIRRDLYLGYDLEVQVYDAKTNQLLPGAEVTLIDPVDGSLLDKQTNTDSSVYHFGVSLGRPYQLNTDRRGYESKTENLAFQEVDLRNGKIIHKVYLNQEDILRLLPVRLYFDNDHPNPRTTRTTTNLDYKTTYEDYYAKKERFIEEFTEGMDPDTAFVTGGRFENFFDLQVKGGWNDLEFFTQRLVEYLENGNELALSLQGFASPRAAPEYNERLSARRNSSVRNYFDRYDNGVLRPYIESGQLRFTTKALGESTADVTRISDRLDDPKGSVFSIIASLERRVEIAKDNGTDQKK